MAIFCVWIVWIRKYKLNDLVCGLSNHSILLCKISIICTKYYDLICWNMEIKLKKKNKKQKNKKKKQKNK